MGNPDQVVFTCRRFKNVDHHFAGPGFGHNYKKQVIVAVREAKKAGHAALVILIDRDRRDNDDTIAPLKAGRDAEAKPGAPACAVGVAVETFDAWMIVDGLAIGKAGGDASKPHSDPENLDGKERSGQHPKDRAQIVLGEDGLAEKYKVIARHARLELLEECCPAGFAPFAEEIRERVLPTVSRSE
jgi:hypothetical protein